MFRRFSAALTLPVLAAIPALLVTGCSGTADGTGGSQGGRLEIVAAESFWGSIASQLAGDRATVHSVIVDPAQDPHSYEPVPADARALATAQLVIVTGTGYDTWAQRLLSANPAPRRLELDVGQLLGLTTGDNPHRWYSPTDVEAVANAITSKLERLQPESRAYFSQRRSAVEHTALAAYHALINRIRARYAGMPVGASESIFALLAPSLGLRLLTPPSFMKAITEGTDVSARDTIQTQRQIAAHQIKVWVYNAQNATPQVQRLNALARAQGVPIATITETLSPASSSFQQWQVSELNALSRALATATGR
ncbi:MAG: metal ABC transporter solute-binding protein, Zn/Mn family [Solirubrobacteraceae bacterium]